MRALVRGACILAGLWGCVTIAAARQDGVDTSTHATTATRLVQRFIQASNGQQRPLGVISKLKKAFTLVELMIATGILVAALGAILVAFLASLLLNESNNNLVVATEDAQYILEAVKGLSYGTIGCSGPALLTYLQTNNLIPQFKLKEESITFNLDCSQTNIVGVTVHVSWNEGQRQRDFPLSTYIAQ